MSPRRWVVSAVSVAGLVAVAQIVTSSKPRLAKSSPTLSITGVAVGSAGGDLSGSFPNPTVAKANGATVPAAGALTTGNVLQVSGASADTYAAVNLAGGAGYVTGSLPDGNQAAQTCTGDVTGNTGATVVSAITGTTPIAITPNVLQWTKGTSAPTLTQATPTTDVATVPLLIQSQAPEVGASVNLIPGNVRLNTPAPIGAGATGFTQIQSGGTTVDSLGYCVGSTTQGCFYGIPNTAPTNANYGLLQTSTLTLLNTPSGGSADIGVGGTAHLVDNATTIGMRLPLGGNTVAFSFSGQTSPNTVACGTGGTQTISAGQSLIPFFLVTTGTLTSNCVVDFGTNAVTGYYTVDLSGVGALGAFTLGFKNGTTTKTISATQLTNLIATGASGAVILTYGTNNITIID